MTACLPHVLSGPRHRRALAAAVGACLAVLLPGCVSQTLLVKNEKASAEVKARGYGDYKQVLFIPPKEDPRQVTPRAVKELETMGFKVRVMDPDKPLEAAQGTGFLITAQGHLLTCAHVVGDEKTATVFLQGKRLLADVVATSTDDDLALLKLRDPAPADAQPLGLRTDAPTMGDDVFTIGYPLSRLLGTNARMSRGLLSATTGMRDDAKRMQVSAEVQPGNSGGPLLARDGQVIGQIQQTINPWRIAQSTGGVLPQNVNFAIKNAPMLEFVKASDPAVAAAMTENRASTLEAANRGVARVLAGTVTEDTDRRSMMVVRLNYVAIWDVWYRFRLFVLAAHDFDTQEVLFVVGQGRDNLISNEEVVIKDTFNKFREAIGRPAPAP